MTEVIPGERRGCGWLLGHLAAAGQSPVDPKGSPLMLRGWFLCTVTGPCAGPRSVRFRVSSA